ncbi:MAG: ABC transporter ATP-binding protein [Ignavibacteria bacterium]|jgi:lipoprotein-releasing system ATP-binding protein
MSIITADSIVKSYSMHAENDTPVLKGISLSIQKGEFIAFMGPSGAGKSTLLHILGLLDSPDSGALYYELSGKTFTHDALKKHVSAELRNRYIGFIFQFHHLLPEFTALENIMMPALIAGMSMSKARSKALALAEQVGMMHRCEHRPSELSGGEQQRIAIARALMNDPEIIIADEPTGNLDSANTISVLQLIRSIRQERSLTLLIATHSMDVARMAERIITLRDGVISSEVNTQSGATQ